MSVPRKALDNRVSLWHGRYLPLFSFFDAVNVGMWKVSYGQYGSNFVFAISTAFPSDTTSTFLQLGAVWLI
jgi:hypothetical protein